MANLNKVFLVGNLTRDPEVRYTPSGKAVADIGLAVNRRYRTQSGEYEEETCFVTVTVWDRAAETCGEYLRKGSPLLVEGRLKFDQWERDGQKHNKLTVVAERTQFLGSPRNAEYRDTPQDTQRPAADPAPGPAAPPRQAEQPTPPHAAPDYDDHTSDSPSGELAADEDNLPF